MKRTALPAGSGIDIEPIERDGPYRLIVSPTGLDYAVQISADYKDRYWVTAYEGKPKTLLGIVSLSEKTPSGIGIRSTPIRKALNDLIEANRGKPAYARRAAATPARRRHAMGTAPQPSNRKAG